MLKTRIVNILHLSLIALCFSCIFCSSATAKEQMNAVSTEPIMINKIKSIEAYSLDPKTGNKTHTSTTHFENNLPIKRFVNKGEETIEERYDYNADGNVTKYTILDSDGNVTYTNISTYQFKNLIAEANNYTTVKNKYDGLGNLIEIKEFNSDGVLEEMKTMVHQYTGDHPDQTETFIKRGEGEAQKSKIQTFTYNKEGLLEKEISRAIFGAWVYTYEYHANGNVKSKTTVNGEDSEKVITLKNEQGNRIKETIYRRKSTDDDYHIDLTHKWTYDKFGNEILFEQIRNGHVVKKRINVITYQ